MTVLVTGAAGFIGAALSERLVRQGERVVGIDNLTDYYSVTLKRDRLRRVEEVAGGTFTFFPADFADAQQLRETLAGQSIQSIAHLGAQAGVRYSLTNPAAYIHSNMVGHFNMLEFARELGCANMVYASSSSVYGGNVKVPFSVEDQVDHPVSLYAATKKADELMSETYSHLYRLPLTGLRFFTVYGPWGRPDMMPWIFTQKILSGMPLPIFNRGEMRRDFTYIDDIIDGVMAALENPPRDDGREKPGGSLAPHAIYNVGNNRPEQLLRFVSVLEEACGRAARLDLLPMQPGDVVQTFADIEPIKRDLGYSPRTSIEEGVARFVGWYRDYHAT